MRHHQSAEAMMEGRVGAQGREIATAPRRTSARVNLSARGLGH